MTNLSHRVKNTRKRRLRFTGDSKLEEDFRTEYRDRSIFAIRILCVFGFAVVMLFMSEDQIIDPINGYKASLVRTALMGVPLATVFVLTFWRASRAHQRLITSLLFFAVTIGMMLVLTILDNEKGYGLSSRTTIGNITLIIIGLYAFSYLRFWLSVAVGLVVFATYTIFMLRFSTLDLNYFLDIDFTNALTILVLCVLLGYNLETSARREFAQQRLIRALLYNTVPERIARRLENDEFPIADAHARVTILFADIVGSSGLAKRLTAGELVAYLNKLFSKFDEAASRYGLEKIKTIGDGYMVAAGLWQEHDDGTETLDEHARVIDLAHDMLAIAASFRRPESDTKLALRIGIHTGEVIAGVIGSSKFSYDIWGDTVNLASRMESSSLPNRIQVSDVTYKLLKDRRRFEPRGSMDIAGFGPVDTYLVTAA